MAKKRFLYVITKEWWVEGNLDPMRCVEPILIVATEDWAVRTVRKLMAEARGGYDETGWWSDTHYSYEWHRVRSLVP